MPMMDDSYDCSYFSSDDLDDSATAFKRSNRRWPRRRSHTPGRSRLIAEASRWESFPSSRRTAPPQRLVTPPLQVRSTSSSLSSDATPPPLLTTVRQESQGCSAPRVPQRQSSLEAVKRNCDLDATDQPQALPTAPAPLRRHISSDDSSGKGTACSPADTSCTLKLPTRQPSFHA